MRSTIVLQGLCVAVAGAAVGLGANALGPRPAPLTRPVHARAETTCEAIPRIAVQEAIALCDGCRAVFVDTRGEDDYASGHVVGAVHLPPAGHPRAAAVLDRLRAAPLVIVYDADASCALASAVAGRLLAEGVPQVRVLDGAWPGWQAASGPGASGSCDACGAPPSAAPGPAGGEVRP